MILVFEESLDVSALKIFFSSNNLSPYIDISNPMQSSMDHAWGCQLVTKDGAVFCASHSLGSPGFIVVLIPLFRLAIVLYCES